MHFTFNSFSQDTTWRCTYGGAGYDEGRSVIETFDTCYIVAGATGSFGYGDADVYVIKVGRNGDKIWSNVYGGPYTDWGYEIEETFDTCYIIAGYTNSFGSGGYDIYLLKIDRTGKLLWQKTFGGIDWDLGYSLEQTPDSGFVIAGETYSFGAGDADVYLLKTDDKGNMQWQKTFGGVKKDIGRSIDQTFDNGFVIAGETWSYGAGENDVYVIKTDDNGDTVWTRTFGGDSVDYGWCIIQTNDSNYLISGTTGSIGFGKLDEYYLKFNEQGTKIWEYTGGNSENSEARCVIENNFTYAYSGYTTSGFGWDREGFIRSSTIDGLYISSPQYGGTNNDEFFTVIKSIDNSLVTVGHTQSLGYYYSDIFIVKSDSLGYTKYPTDTSFSDSVMISNITSRAIKPIPFKIIQKKLLIDNSLLKKNGSFILLLYNYLGQTISILYSDDIESGIDLNGLNAGFYNFEVVFENKINGTGNSGHYCGKFIIF